MAQTVYNHNGYTDVQFRFPAAANAINGFVFHATRPYNVKGAYWIHGTAETTAATLTVDVTKETGTGAAASGSSVLSATFNAKSTANTSQTATSTATLAAGNRLSVKFSASATELAGGLLTLRLQAA